MKKFELNPCLVKATIADASVIENMWFYYVYDLTRYCGFMKGWESPTELSFKSDDLTNFFTAQESNLFLIKIDNENAGFVLVKKLNVMPEIDWFMSEFYIISKYQRSGVGKIVAKEVFEKFHGEWGIGVLPENTPALKFWRNVLMEHTQGKYYEVEKTSEQLKSPEHPDPHPMVILKFKAS